VSDDKRVVVDFHGVDDAAVVRLDGKEAIVQTVDFFTPIVDDPYDFGQIAAANAISDIYAMGAIPLFALNIVAFPRKDLPMEILSEILKGGNDKAKEAGISIVGGHSIDDKEPKYGLVVTGRAEVDRLVKNSTASVGDLLVLTKPLGTGIVATGIKRGIADDSMIAEATKVMTTLNADASELMLKLGAHAATDVTGFGLLGHLLEMCQASDVSAEIKFEKLPFMNGVNKLAEKEIIPGGTKRNLAYVSSYVSFNSRISSNQKIMAADAQTSGGLLIAMPRDRTHQFVKNFNAISDIKATIVGQVTSPQETRITVV
jgi:selenide,water dikinase